MGKNTGSVPPPQRDSCARCQGEFPGYDLVGTVLDDGADITRCWRCHNQHVADLHGVPFDHEDLPPLILRDGHGVRREIQFRVRLLGDMVAVDAFDVVDDTPGAYQLMEIGTWEDDPRELRERLAQRISRLARARHIRRRGRSAYELTDEWVLRGRLTWDPEFGGYLPRVAVDGRELSWEELGRMLSSFEGFQIKIEVFGREEDR